MNLATLAQRQAERYGDRLLALVNGEPVTYADLAGKSARFRTPSDSPGCSDRAGCRA